MRCVEPRQRSRTPAGGAPHHLAGAGLGDAAAQALADELGTTPNDAIVRLAEEGIAATERRRRAERIAGERRDAVARAGAPDGVGFPTAEEMHAAMLSGRRAS